MGSPVKIPAEAQNNPLDVREESTWGRRYARGECSMGAARINLRRIECFSAANRFPYVSITGITSFGPTSNIGAIGCAEMFLVKGSLATPICVVAYHARVRNTDGSRLGGGRRGGGGGRSRQRQRSEPRGMPRALSTDTLQHSDTHSYRDRPRSRSE